VLQRWARYSKPALLRARLRATTKDLHWFLSLLIVRGGFAPWGGRCFRGDPPLWLFSRLLLRPIFVVKAQPKSNEVMHCPVRLFLWRPHALRASLVTHFFLGGRGRFVCRMNIIQFPRSIASIVFYPFSWCSTGSFPACKCLASSSPLKIISKYPFSSSISNFPIFSRQPVGQFQAALGPG
jgi:hypothetical protein